MKNTLLIISLCLLAFLTSCKNNTTQKTGAVNLYSKEGVLLTSIQKPEIVSRIKKSIQTCKKTYAKILPIYDYYIEINMNGEKQSWLISNLGYIKRKDIDSIQLYKVEDAEALAKYLQ